MKLLRGFSVALFTVLTTWSVGAAAVEAYDPLEPINRGVFAFNRKLDDYLLKPVATTYQKVVPHYFQDGFDNFFSNFRDIWSAANLMVQGRGTDGLNQFLRVGVNSTFGFLGWLDIATEMGLRRERQDFGQTLGRLGVGPGPYIVWPFLGPSTLRDSIDIPALWKIAPEPFIEDIPLRNVTWGIDIVRFRASLLGASNLLDDVSLDPYTFVRDGYLQRRRSLIYDGDPPDEPNDTPSDDDKPSSSRLEGALELQAWSTEALGGGGLLALRHGPQAAKDPVGGEEPRAEVRSESRVQSVSRVRSGWSAVASERPRETDFVPAP